MRFLRNARNLASLAALSLLVFPASSRGADVTASIETLGNPGFTKYLDGTSRVYARNVWDLKAYGGRIYIGEGNSSNEGPGQNASLAPIYFYDPASNSFTLSYQVMGCQVDVFYIFTDGLWTPGHDTVLDWNTGSDVFHMNADGTWSWLYGQMPGEVHTYCMAEYDGKLFAAGYYIYSSTNRAATWTELSSQSRVHAFLQFPDQLYAVTEYTYTYKYSGSGFSYKSALSRSAPYPNTTLRTNETKIIHPCQLTGISDSKTAYIGAYMHNDHQSLPFGVYIATSSGSSLSFSKVTALPSNCRPWDIMLTNRTVYVLLEETNTVPTVNRVWASTNLTTWTEQFSFTYPTFARSFELLDGDFYFGMGCEITNSANWKQSELKPETGYILRLKATPPAPTLPAFALSPTNLTVNYGQTALFGAVATGVGLLGYQWQRDGVDIAGATSVVYTTAATVEADSGSSYACVVSNVAGSVTSSVAVLTVNMKPAITSQPGNQTGNYGQTATFSITATGLGIGYQWWRDGAAVSGATNRTCTTPILALADSGSTFKCVLTNAYGSTTSSVATLTVNMKPVFTTQPANKTVNVGETATFTAGSPSWNITNQWYKKGVAISGARAMAYTTPATTLADSGATFYCVLTNEYGSTTSSVATLTVVTPPTISFTTVSQSKAENGTNATVIAKLSSAPALAITLPFTLSGTAVKNTDYTITATPLTIPVGVTTGTITVTLTSDAVYESNETVIVTMGTPTNATLGASNTVHTLTILDDDVPPAVIFGTVSQSKAENGGTATIATRLSAAAGVPVFVPFTLGGTASEGSDYTVVSNPVVIAAGSTTANLSLPIINDTLDEPDETVVVTMGTPVNGTMGTSNTVHTLTLTDNDNAPTVNFTAASWRLAESDGPATVTAQLSAMSGQDVTIPFTLSGTASNGVDYTIAASPVVIPAGSTNTTIAIAIDDDTTPESNKTVIVTMGTPTNGTKGATSVCTLTILDDDTLPLLSFTAASQVQAESAGTVDIEARLSVASDQPVTLPFTLAGTASNRVDYGIAASPVTIPAGSTNVTISVTITNDTLYETNETLIVNLGTLSNAVPGVITNHILTILDDDVAPSVSFTSGSQTQLENVASAAITAELSAAAGLAVSLPFTLSGTASNGVDYAITASPVTIAAGSTNATILVALVNDAIYESNETVTVAMGTPSNATRGGITNHTLTIADNDAAGLLGPSAATIGLPDLTDSLVLALTNRAGTPLTYAWAQVSGPAGASAQFTAPTEEAGAVAFPAAGVYALRCTVGNGEQSLPVDLTVNAGVSLPALTGSDIGAVAAAGSHTISNDSYTVNGSGADIWGTADEFYYLRAPLGGNFQVTARVVSIQNTTGWAKGGVMIRQSTNANSAYAIMAMTPANGAAFQYRTTTGGSASSSNQTGLSAPYWVRLVRSGNTLTGYSSPDGSTWTQRGTATLTMTDPVQVGLAVCSVVDGTLCRTVFDNVAGLPNVNDAPSVDPGTGSAALAGTPYALDGQATDDGQPAGSTLSPLWTRQSGPGTMAFSAATNPASTATFDTNGTYVLRLTASDGSATVFEERTVQVMDYLMRTVTVSTPYGAAQPGTTNVSYGTILNAGIVPSVVTTVTDRVRVRVKDVKVTGNDYSVSP